MATTPHILDSYPSPSAIGIAIGDSVSVTFDQEMDLDSINLGTFLLVAPDTSVIFMGPELSPFDGPTLDDDALLSSPYYGGYVKGTISFSKVDIYGAPVDESAVDYTGVGNLWRTVATFTPTGVLSPNKTYSVIVAGDEDPTNRFDSGVRTRTVFDANPVAVTGTGIITSAGGYTGDITKTYVIEITSSGIVGNAAYEWWEESDPLTTFAGITTTGRRELNDGTCIYCDPDGTFSVGDRWTITVVPFISLPTTYQWSFTTGSGSIITPSSTSSASGIDALSSTTETLRVISITPVDAATNLNPQEVTQIIIKFNKEIDPLYVTDSMIRITSEPVNGIFYNNPITYSGTLAKVLTVSGDTIIAQIS